MNGHEYKQKLENSFGLQLIVTGLTALVEDEGYSPREALEMLRHTERNVFHALVEIGGEGKNHATKRGNS